MQPNSKGTKMIEIESSKRLLNLRSTLGIEEDDGIEDINADEHEDISTNSR